jgi:S1-C subfamily serine protease
MNLKNVLPVCVAIFVGVFTALQLDRWMDHRSAHPDIPLLPESSAAALPVSLDQTAPSGELDFRQAAHKVIPSVVSVDRYEQITDFFGNDSGQIRETGTGSGVIVSDRNGTGIIVTNNHVVADQRGEVVPEVKVRLNDKRSFRAKVIGNDPLSDIAVIQISASDLTPIELGRSSSLAIGQWVMAVGNPLGFDDTVSVGVVSSLNRNLPVGANGLVDAIQTDAAINPGNSGGALTDQQGRLVGINSAIASQTGGSVGIGFAIPIDRVRSVVNEIITYGHARHGDLGVFYRQRLNEALADEDVRQQLAEQTGANNVPNSGIIVIGAAGPAAQAGLKQFDVLLEVDGVPMNTSFDYNRALISKKPGDKVTIKWWSAGQTKTATVTLQETGGSIE